MRTKFFFLLICLLATGILGANNTPISLTPPVSGDEGGCNLPAPMNFQVTELGPTWATFGWGGNAASQHRIRIYQESNNALLSTTTVPAGVAIATIAIPFNTPVTAVINAICLDGTHSPNNSIDGGVTGLIFDLVVTGYNGSSNSSSCNIIGYGSCTFPNSGYTTFKVSMNNSYFTKFDVVPSSYGEEGSPKFTVRPEHGNSGDNNTFSFYCNSNTEPEPGCYGAELVTITYWLNGTETVVGVLQGSRFYNGTLINKLTGTLYNYGGTFCKIDRLGPAGMSGPTSGSINERDGQFAATTLPATASPNPFSDMLEVYLAKYAANSVTLQLYNLSGQKVLDQQFAGGQIQYTLPTASLSPGFYMLRIEADGEVQTLKVVKSE